MFDCQTTSRNATTDASFSCAVFLHCFFNIVFYLDIFSNKEIKSYGRFNQQNQNLGLSMETNKQKRTC